MQIIAMETENSSCFYHSMMMNRSLRDSSEVDGRDRYTVPSDGEDVVVHLPADSQAVSCREGAGEEVHLVKRTPTSIASSLQASIPSAEVVRMALKWRGGVRCAIIPDELAVETLLQFVGMFAFGRSGLLSDIDSRIRDA